MKEVRSQKSEVRAQSKDSRKYLLICILYSVFCILCFPSYLGANQSIPEKLVYSLYWSGIKAGSASLEVDNTAEGVRIISRAASADFISLFYRVEDIVQSTLYQDGYPKNYRIKLREGRHRRNKEVEFSEELEKGSQKIIYKNRLNNETAEFSFEKKAYDSLSGFYAIRKRQLKIGNSEYINVFDSKKLWNVEVQVLRKEHISTPAGEFNTIVIKPILKSEGIFMKKGDVYIWLTDDERKIPVMMKSKIKIGSITAKLIRGEY